MKETLSLFHTTLGVVETRKVLRTTGMCFQVAGIPRELCGGCELYIYIDCVVDKEDEWIILGRTEPIYHLKNGDWRCLVTSPPS